MMTHDEIIEVVKAHKEGELIEYSNSNIPWLPLHHMGINQILKHIIANEYRFRVKPKSKYRQYLTADEVPVGGVVKDKDGFRCVITGAEGARVQWKIADTVMITAGPKRYEASYFMENYKFEDGSPCGIPVKESNN